MVRMTARIALKDRWSCGSSREDLLKTDIDVLRQRKVRFSSIAKGSLNDFLAGPSEKNDVFHMALSPVPFVGDLQTADIFLLMLNPSLGAADYATNEKSEFQAILEKTLLQDLKSESHQCFALNPKYWWSSWFVYYEKLFRNAIWGHVDASEKAITYAKALNDLSNRLAILELVPYYSGRATQITATRSQLLPSAKLARDAAEEIAMQAADGKALVLLRWGQGIWDLKNTDSIKRPESMYGFRRFEKEIIDRLGTPAPTFVQLEHDHVKAETYTEEERKPHDE